MRKARLQEQVKSLQHEVSALRSQNVMLKDTIMILSSQLGKQRQEKQTYLRTIQKIDQQHSDTKSYLTEENGRIPSTFSIAPPSKLKRALSKQILSSPKHQNLVACKYPLVKKQSSQSYPMEVQRRATICQSGGYGTLHRLKTLKQLHKEEMAKDQLRTVPEL